MAHGPGGASPDRAVPGCTLPDGWGWGEVAAVAAVVASAVVAAHAARSKSATGV